MSEVIDNTTFRKNFIWNVIGMTCNSFNSLFYMIIVTRINGIEDAGLFTFAFSLGCLFYLVGVYSGRVFQVTDVNEKNTDIDYIFQRILTCGLMMIISYIYSKIMGYSKIKFWIVMLLCMMKCLEAFADVFYGVLQKKGLLYKSGISMTLKSVISLLCFMVIDFFTKNIVISIICGILVTWIFIIFLYDIPQAKRVICSFKISYKSICRIFNKGFFLFLVNFFAVFIVNESKYILDIYGNASQQAVFGIILMPATLVSIAVQYFIQPYLKILTDLYKKKLIVEYNKTILKLLIITFVIGICCIIGAYFLGIPVLSLVYGINLNGNLLYLEIIILGAIFYSMSLILSIGLTTVRFTFIQVIVYLITILISFLYAPILISSNLLEGAVNSYFLLMISQFLLYLIIYIYLFLSKKIFINNKKDYLYKEGLS